MAKNTKIFDQRLLSLMIIGGVSREELARRLRVPVPVVSRWLNGTSTPDVYQLREIARFLDVPYEWLLGDGGGLSTKAKLAKKLGLSEETVGAMMFVADSDDSAIMKEVENAIWAVFSTVIKIYDHVEKQLGCEDDLT